MNTLMVTENPMKKIVVYKFCGIYKYLAKVNGVMKCKSLGDKKFMNLGFPFIAKDQ